MIAELSRDEGRLPYLYKDSLGLYTVGMGRLVDRDKDKALTHKDAFLSNDEIDYLANNDINRALADIQNEPWFLACDTDARRRALVNMRFQLGGAGLREFVNSLALIAAKKWNEAADHLAKSKWAAQTPERAARVIAQIRTGQ